MVVLTTRVDPRSEDARANAAAMRALVEELRARRRARSPSATGEEVSAKDLGHASVHARISGVADHESPEDEPHAGERARFSVV